MEPLPGFGDISGDCGLLAGSLATSSADLLSNAIDFGSESYSKAQLSEGGQEIIIDGSLGGSSSESEAIAYEILYRCEGATLTATEPEITYSDDGGKKTDMLVDVGGQMIGVSVTRAYHYPPEEPYPLDEAVALLEDKLADIPLAEDNAAPPWDRSVLSVIAWDDVAAEAVRTAWSDLSGSLRDDIVVIVTTSDGDDAFLY